MSSSASDCATVGYDISLSVSSCNIMSYDSVKFC